MSLRRTTILTLAALLTVVGVARGARLLLDRRAGGERVPRPPAAAGGAARRQRRAGRPLSCRRTTARTTSSSRSGSADDRPDICAAPACRFRAASGPGFSEVDAAGHAWRVFALVLPDRTVQVGQQQEVRREMASGRGAGGAPATPARDPGGLDRRRHGASPRLRAAGAGDRCDRRPRRRRRLADPRERRAGRGCGRSWQR